MIPTLDSAQNASKDVMINPVQGYEVCATFVNQADLDALNPASDAPEETPEPTPEPTAEATVTPEPTPMPSTSTSSGSSPANSVTQPSSGGSGSGGSGSGSTTIEYYSDDPADYPPGTVFTYDDQGNLTGVYVPDENGDVLLPDKN